MIPSNKDADLSDFWKTSIAESGKMEAGTSLSFSIDKTWDNKPIDHEPATVVLSGSEGDLIIDITAPFFDDPSPEGGMIGEAYYKLWDYEVVEAFLLNDKNQYLELEFGTHGQHLALLLNGNRNAIKHSLPLDFSATINTDHNTWTGEARIPASYFPPNVSKFNAYAIHGVGEKRIYEALYEVSGPQPDFHRLEKFKPLRLEDLLEENKNEELSDIWKNAIGEEQ